MALGDGSGWNEALPDNTTVANQIDDYDRDLRLGVRSRMAIEHIWPASQTATAQAGYHTLITFQAQTAAPTLVASSGQVGALYVQTNSLFFENSAGTSTKILSATSKIDAANIVAAAALPAGAVVQVVNTQTGALATGTTTVPTDDTIPQNTEGDEYMTLAITPTSATNKLRIDVSINVATSVSGGHTLTAALFQDSTADALAAASMDTELANKQRQITFTYYMTSGTTSSTTFKVRAGAGSAGTTTFNGGSGGRFMGGVMASSITITEIQV